MKHHFYAQHVVLLFVVSVTFFACERAEKVQNVRSAKGEVTLGGTLRVAAIDVPAEIDPLRMNNASAAEIGVHMYDGLTKLHPNSSELKPAIAESWSAEDGGKSWVFNLRKGVRFHDHELIENTSREVTASDVKETFSRLAKDAPNEMFLSTIGKKLRGAVAYRNGESADLDAVSVIDDYTIRIQLNEPDASFLYILAQPSLGIIPSNMDGESSTIGAGPFKFEYSEKGLMLVRNADYYLEDEFGNNYPYIDTLIFVEVGSNTEKLEAFFNGEIDVITNLELDPVRSILEQHVAEFSGKSPKYVMQRETENASYETYSIYRSGIKNLGSGFIGYRDYSRVQIEQKAQ